MRIAYTLLLSTSLLFTSACSTMNKSLQLGATMGAATGAAATYPGQHSAGKHKGQDVALGAAIGLGVGLITSFFTHKEVEEDRELYRSSQIEMHFGDLPPSPFLVPKYKKKGGR
ncbi:MAG: hypothetical protein H6626_12885 [Pseudobdellovibrionaceae bacterium]|nr:MAG: hypothetical protein H6626_12885 [Pseudobdellovibrionaceae bacterium]